MRRPIVLTFALLAGALSPVAGAQTAAPSVPPFSATKPGATQAPWETVKINERKTLTKYDLVDNGGQTVLHATADSSASALGVMLNADLAAAPVLTWRWRVANLVADADNSVAGKEDSPARIMLEFDGDKSKLSFGDRTASRLASSLSGRELPYATLMYVYSSTAPVGTIIPNPHAKRIQMIVVSTGETGVGKWQSLRRNVREDFKKVFGEEPGVLKSVSVMTDTDNIGTKAEAWYGDLQFLPN